MATRKVARSSISGRFVSQRVARLQPASTQVETVEVPQRRIRNRRRAVRHAAGKTRTSAD
jgi:hypothetical protein